EQLTLLQQRNTNNTGLLYLIGQPNKTCTHSQRTKYIPHSLPVRQGQTCFHLYTPNNFVGRPIKQYIDRLQSIEELKLLIDVAGVQQSTSSDSFNFCWDIRSFLKHSTE
ncbi:10304_t:CDS:2, partial [Paraglomus brasilianum]